MSRRTFGLFSVSLLVMAAVTFGLVFVASPARQPSLASGVSPEDQAAGFGLVSDPSNGPTTLGPPPTESVIQLVSFNPDKPPLTSERAPWWNPSGFPRIDPITQFDHGQLEGVNCVMAAGAMLARLAYAIPTSGTQLRALQSDQSGGTNLGNLNDALQKGWHVRFARGWLTPLQLRALLWAGAGAVVLVNYGRIPVGLRIQKNFTGGHALYFDGFREAAADTPAAYYVIDPIGRPSRGYRGEWWPASVMEDAGIDFGGGRIVTSWAFAGGTLPNGAYPHLPPQAFPTEHGNPPPHASPEPVPEEPASPPDVSAGDDPPPTPSDADSGLGSGATVGGVSLASVLALCTGSSPPAYCPVGLVGVYPPPVAPPPTLPPLIGTVPIDLLYASTPQPGFEQVIFTAQAGIQPIASYWSPGSGQVLQADVEAATINGTAAWIATFPVQPGTYDLVVSGVGSNVAGLSPVATLTVSGG
jgi:hypothetical protein